MRKRIMKQQRNLFQFHKVRLKAIYTHRSTGKRTLFQFHKVRLKALSGRDNSPE